MAAGRALGRQTASRDTGVGAGIKGPAPMYLIQWFPNVQRASTTKWRRPVFCGFVVLLYAVTWVGGWMTHARDLKSSADAKYQRAQECNAQRLEAFRSLGLHEPYTVELWKSGPASRVNWCVPLLPGVLLADSSWGYGPLNGDGGVKIVFYYGFGSVEVCRLWGWYA
jgi:hypothetical protein